MKKRFNLLVQLLLDLGYRQLPETIQFLVILLKAMAVRLIAHVLNFKTKGSVPQNSLGVI